MEYINPWAVAFFIIVLIGFLAKIYFDRKDKESKNQILETMDLISKENEKQYKILKDIERDII